MMQSNRRTSPKRVMLALSAVLSAGTAGLPARVVLAQEAASAVQDVTLQDVTLVFGDTRVIAPVLTVSGTRLSKTDLLAILRSDSSEPWPARLARLDAGSIVAPELRVERADGQTRQIATYRDVTAKGVQGGRVVELKAAGAVLSATGSAANAAGTGSYGRMRAEEVDLTALARIVSEPGDGKGPLQRLYSAFSVDAIVVGDEEATVKVASLSGRDLAMRPVPNGWTGAAKALGDLDSADPVQRAKLGALGADLIEGLSVGSIVMSGLSITTFKDEPAELGIGRVTYAGGSERSVALSDIAFAAAGTRSQLATLTLTGFSLEPTVAALRQLSKNGGAKDAELRKLTPLLGTLSLSGLNLDLPQARDAKGQPGDPLSDAAASAPLHLGLRDAAVSFGPPKDGVPVAGRLSLGGLTMPASLVAGVPGLGVLPLYGYRDLDLDLVADTTWNEPAKELTLRELSVSGKDMGSLTFSGLLGGIGPDVFDPDTAVSAFAMLSATAKALDVTVKNGGLFERFIDTTAKSLSLKPDELRKEYVTASVIGVPVILGNSPAAKSIGAAIGKFVTKPDTLSISARPKNGAGFGAVDFSTAPTPAAVLDKLEINAKSE